jgi:signal peptidase
VNLHRPAAATLGRSAGRWAGRLLALVVLGLLAAAITVVVLIPRATHGQAMTVLTGSMTPGIPVGSIVVVRPVDPGTLEVGDIATYQKDKGGDTFVTHRVVDIDTSTRPTTYIFKGDANRGPDVEPIVPDRIIGEVWFHVPHLGTIRDGLAGSGGVTLVGILLLGGYAASQIRTGMRQRRGVLQTLPVDRRIIAARFARGAELDPRSLPSHWGALLVHEDSDGFALLVVPQRDAFDLVLTQVRAHSPTAVTVTAPSGHVTLPPPDDTPAEASEKERTGAEH